MKLEQDLPPSVVIFENKKEWARLVEHMIGEVLPIIVISQYQTAVKFIEAINKISDIKEFPLASFIVGGNDLDIELNNKRGETLIKKILEGPYKDLPIFGFAFDYNLQGATCQIQKDPEKFVLLTNWINAQKVKV